VRQIGESSPKGFAIALHINFASPKYLLQSYPKEWMDHYSREGLVMQDPTVRWGFSHSGAKRWSDLVDDDPAGVIAAANGYGLAYGVTVAMEPETSRTVASFARDDREFDDVEIATLSKALASLHEATREIEALSPEVHASMKQMSIILTHR
jgi:LuxR family transcriptional regulator